MNAKTKFALDVGLLILSQVVLFYGVKLIISSLDPNRTRRNDSKNKTARIISKLGLQKVNMNEHEEVIASELVLPDEISATFKSIGGLDPIISDLRETVIYPLMYPQLYTSASNLLGAPKGVLLYGPPGCGKTLLAKALAKESGATFINLHVSTLTEKWFGESQKLVRAVFTLAKKLQPAIVFIDEIDSFLRERGKSDHEAMAMMKAEFMTLWDGLGTSDNSRILILGATNRPNDIDSAILRRMPKRFAINLPDQNQRKKILQILLADVNLDTKFDYDYILRKTENFSGSDLKELCRNAAMVPVRESIRKLEGDMKTNAADDSRNINVRPLRSTDFFSSVSSNNELPKVELD